MNNSKSCSNEEHNIITKLGLSLKAKDGGADSTGQLSRLARRGLTEAELEGVNYEFAMPSKLVQLAVEHDKMFTY